MGHSRPVIARRPCPIRRRLPFVSGAPPDHHATLGADGRGHKAPRIIEDHAEYAINLIRFRLLSGALRRPVPRA